MKKYGIVKIGLWTWQIANTPYIFDSYLKAKSIRNLLFKNKVDSNYFYENMNRSYTDESVKEKDTLKK